MLNTLNALAPLALFSALDDVMGKTIGASATASSFAPAVDIRSNQDDILMTLDVPGLKQSDLELSVENGVLTVRGERKYNGGTEEQAWLGRRYGAFSKSFTLPDFADSERISADLSDGVLTIRVPRLERAKPRKVSISVGSSEGEAKQLSDTNS